MARHSLYPGFVRIHYTSNGHPHTQVLPINADPTAVGGSYTIPTRAAGAVDWRDAVDEYGALMAALFDVDATLDYADLFNLESGTAPPGFLGSHPMGVAGTGVGGAVEFCQLVTPYKGIGGVSLRPYYMETEYTEDAKETFAGSANPILAVLEYILSDDDWIACRGGEFPVVSLGYITKENDELRRKYFNP